MADELSLSNKCKCGCGAPVRTGRYIKKHWYRDPEWVATKGKEKAQRISSSKKGKSYNRVDYRHSEETKRRISIANQGKKRSPEQIARSIGVRVKPNRDGDKRQAHSRVTQAVLGGLLPRAKDLPCVDCGKFGIKHEYDHYLGYDAAHFLDVEAVCKPCHIRREIRRGVQVGPYRKGVTKKCVWCSSSFYVHLSKKNRECCSRSCTMYLRYQRRRTT